jgi:hypothetical protein
MPYIKQGRRDAIELIRTGHIDPREIKTVGELNYAITRLMVWFMVNNGGISYSNGAAARAAAYDASEELYRRIMADYEDQKKLENGDVYSPLIRKGNA